MKSIRSRFTFLTVLAVIISVLVTIVIFYFPVNRYLRERTDEVLGLVCAERQEVLDNYFNSIEQSVDTVANYAEDDIASETDLEAHIDKTEKLFSTIASNTQGTLTYYYRVDPEIAKGEKGFWYQSDGNGKFVSSELTEIVRYDPGDVSRVGWYYIPKNSEEPVWIEPYYNENMGAKMISYVVPVYHNGEFFGVAGMDFSYESLVANMEDIEEFRTGYAFLANENGEIIYHKDLESGTHISDAVPGEALESAEGGKAIIRYKFNGTDKLAVSAVLSNDMRLYVTVDEAEINAGQERLLSILFVSAAFLIVLFLLLTFWLVGRITRPLSELTQAALAAESGNYDFELKYDRDDEIGILAKAFMKSRDIIVSRIGSLNNMAYKDVLTSVRNKSAMNDYMQAIDTRIASGEEQPKFAVCMFDCNGLKEINDIYGHDKGDLYLIATCSLICDVFVHSAVFRAGGDEFVAVLQNADYENRDEVCRRFDSRAAETVRNGAEPWDRISVARGLAVYDPDTDKCSADVLKRADEQMYEYKKHMKGNA